MTALCGGGTSGVKPGNAAVLDLTASIAGQLLGLVESPWLIPIIALLDLAPLTLSTFCSTDPPAMVALTLAESTALLTYAIGSTDFNSGIIKAANNVLNGAWANFCQCTIGGAITPPVAPAAPAGTAIYTPPSTAGAGACATSGPFTRIVDASHTGGFQGNFHIWGGENITSYVMTVKSTITTAPGYAINAHFQYIDPNSTASDNTHFVSVPPGGTSITTWPFNPTLSEVQANWTAGAGSGACSFDTTIDVYCGGSSPTGGSGCCPPDAATQGTLDAILAMVTLLQRQSTPFAYIVSTAHTGLSGNSQFAVHGLIGLAIAITTLPTRAGVQLGNPDTLWDVGWIDVGTADGWFNRAFLKTNPQVIFPRDMGAVTLIGYSIPADVVVTITELVREP